MSHAEALRPSQHLFTPPGDTTGQDSWFVLEKHRVRQGRYGEAGLGGWDYRWAAVDGGVGQGAQGEDYRGVGGLL